MNSRILAVAVDCHDAEALAAFWRAALGYPDTKRWRDAKGVEYVQLEGDGPMLLFQPVDDEKVVKNRLHLDLAPTDGSQAEEVDRLVGLGAKVVADEPEFPWIVLTDPEGNEFCVLPPRG
ncbi:putative enzyme related to lactoylglutathione lyase [Amycolatopsis bartoniae]|nr:VOC family protein [Amycolatopsis bartoniae]MBB2933114.1 putative enzyme related to lactoylglutathione lyase [Amycolatopsis bartoniae]TVT11885.1 VOC family protein [Amycolatopsis bartoniae]